MLLTGRRSNRYWVGQDHVTSTLFVCWAVQAALNILYGIPKQTRAEKISGVYEHHILHPHALLTRGFDDSFTAPHSRYADLFATIPILRSSRRRKRAMRICSPVKISASPLSPATEYDANTTASEYFRDVEAGLNPEIPHNYFPQRRPAEQTARHGAATAICCSLTGLTITSTRLRHTICVI